MPTPQEGRNFINGILNDNNHWVEDLDEIEMVLKSYFINFFSPLPVLLKKQSIKLS